MAKTKISEFSSTPANNTDIDSINIAEGCAPSGINDAIRELMAQLKDFQTGAVGDSFNGPVGTTTAASGAFTTLAASGAVTLSGGTANGVAYLNGSKVVTSGSALTFDGTNFATTGNGTFSGILSRIHAQGTDAYITNTTTGKANTVMGFNDSGSTTAQGIPTGYAYYGTLQSYPIGFTSGGYLTNSISSTAHIWNTTGSEQMRLTSTGLGIGTSSPAYKLDVVGSVQSSAGYYINGNTSGGYIWVRDNYALRFGTNDTERMRLDQSGNLGLGVTPSAWWVGFKAIELSSNGAALLGQTNAPVTHLTANATNNGTNWLYKTTYYASRYEQDATSGKHAWYTAASGTAGNAITFTQAATLTANGEFLIGTTSFSYNPTQGATISGGSVGAIGIGHALGTTDGNGYLNFTYNGTNIGSVTQNSTTSVAYNTSSDYRLKDITGPITTSGAYIDSLNPVEGTWKADGSTFVGLIAHEVQEASRTNVATGVKDGEEMQAMDYSNSELIANLIAEVKSLRQRVATLEAK